MEAARRGCPFSERYPGFVFTCSLRAIERLVFNKNLKVKLNRKL